MIIECPREQDVLEALAAQRWPRRCDEDLRTHVAGCAICTDLIEVVRPLLEEQSAAADEVKVPPAAIVWWGAQIRARHEAARAAARPMTIAQAVAAGSVLAIAVALVVTGWARLDSWRTAIVSLVATVTAQRGEFSVPALPDWAFLVVLALGASLVLGTIAIYFVVSEE